jgi:hypothetical protein
MAMGNVSPKLPVGALDATLVIAPVVIKAAVDTGLIPLGLPNGPGGSGAVLEFDLGAIGDPIAGGIAYTITLQEGDDAAGTDLALCGAESVVGSDGAGTNAQGGTFASGIVAVINAADEDSTKYSIAYVGKRSYVKAFITPANLPGSPVGLPVAVTIRAINPRYVGAFLQS